MENGITGPLILSFKLAATTLVILLLFGIPLSAWITRKKTGARTIVESLLSLPLLLPPTVIGFYLLISFSPAFGFGKWMDQHLGLRLAFSFPGIVVGSVFFSLPFFLNPLITALRALPGSLREASLSLGKNETTTFLKILLPNARHGLLTGMMMAFAHTLGEFGVVLMVGGNIPGHTRTASLAIYDRFEAMDYAAAHTWSFILVGISLLFLISIHLLNRQRS